MKRAILLLSLIFTLVLNSCSYIDFFIQEDRLYIGADELRESAKEFVRNNVDTAKVSCSVDDYPSNIENFEENNGELLSDEYVRRVFSLLTDEMFDDMICFEMAGTSFPARKDSIVNGYTAECPRDIDAIYCDSDGSYFDSYIFHFGPDKQLKFGTIYVIDKNGICYACKIFAE